MNPARLVASCALLCAASCSTFPTIERDDCGNGIIESNEDCDTFAPYPHASCRAEGSAGECRLDCTLHSDGSRAQCPDGWGCDINALCRPPTGAYARLELFPVGGAVSLTTGDFDDDGRDEVISSDAPDALGRRKLRFHYFDEHALLDDTRVFPKLVISPTIDDVNGDGHSDVVFSAGSVGLLLGQSDRSWLPETFSSYRVPDAPVRIVGVSNESIRNILAIVVLTAQGGDYGYYVPDPDTGSLRRVGDLAQPIERLAGHPTTGELVEASPCAEVVLGFAGDTAFSVVDPCLRAPATNEITWRSKVVDCSIALEPPLPISAAPLVADVDLDGHLDVLVGTRDDTYVAYGDGVWNCDPSAGAPAPVARPLALDGIPTPIPMPLAAAELTGDGVVDFVFKDHLRLSRPTFGESRSSYEIAYANVGAPWTIARIADFNGNGKLDVVAAASGRLDLDFVSGTGTPDMVPSRVPTSAPVGHLTVNDFDGDSLADVAFSQSGTEADGRDGVAIAFGNAFSPPASPTTVARVKGISALSSMVQEGMGNLSVASDDTIAGRKYGLIALLQGSSDRLPFAYYDLVSFATDGSLENSTALALLAGEFTVAGRTDVFALAAQGEQIVKTGLWLLPGLETTSSQIRLDGEIDPHLALPSTWDEALRLHVTGAAADFDGDGRDDALWVVPAAGQSTCGLGIFSFEPRSPPALRARPAIVLDESCSNSEVRAADVDGDGWQDIALLTEDSTSARHLLVLWNRGGGEFSGASSSVVNGDDVPLAFAVRRAATHWPLELVYVTEQSLIAARVTKPRSFERKVLASGLERATGVAAGDLNGDGVTDLAIAERGNIGVLAAELSAP